MVVNNNYLNHINRIPGTGNAAPAAHPARVRGSDFKTMLQEAVEKGREVKFSKHAELRLRDRRINLDAGQVERLGGAVDRAEKKGVKDTLVLVDDVALVVNVRNRTVVTAVGKEELRENVFTNIDGAVII